LAGGEWTEFAGDWNQAVKQVSMDDAELKNEMLELTLACQRDDATPEQRARLERLLEDDPRAIAWYLRVVDDTLTLRDAAAVSKSGAPAVDCDECRAVVAALEEAERDPSTLHLPMFGALRPSFWWAATACGILVAITGAWWMSARQSVALASSADETGSARVVSVANVRWADGAKEFKEWSFVRPGDVLHFDAGLVNLFLSNGAEVLVEGPADVTFESLQKMFARQGKLAARVGPGAIGFRIETPHANVIDRGTAFGVSVDANSRTGVVVYDGIVDLDVLGNSSHPRRRLATGEGVSVNRDGELSRITTVQSADFLEPPQARPVEADAGRVIAAVSDNVRSLETAKYYRVIPRGFREDCRAYVDRDHEWNGLDERGLPPFMVGGDYVMTFNDDKIVAGIELAVTLNQPATLYVLVDDRVEPPDWLKRDFVDTHWDLGSDEGYADRIIDNGVGAGQSVDHVCSVWQRDVVEPTTVVLGALSHETSPVPAVDVERSMYGVVAVPLARER
jgi:hypothetical protein